jgi:hypothetical protein
VLQGHRCAHKLLQNHCLTASMHTGGEVFKRVEASGAVMITLISVQQSSCYSLMDRNKAVVVCDLQQFAVHHRDQH